MRVDVVALLYVLQDVVIVDILSLCLQFVVATLCTYFGRGCNEYFEFGFGENHRTNVAAVHYDALVLAHALLLSCHGTAYKRQGCNRTHVAAHLHAANFVLNTLSVEKREWQFCIGVEAEAHFHLGHHLLQFVSLYATVFVEELVL